MTNKYYKDTINGILAFAPSRSMAWQLIRNKCHQFRLQVPTIDQVIEVDQNSNVDLQINTTLPSGDKKV